MKRVEQAHLAVAALSDEGRRGKNNEDRYGVSAFRRKDRQSTPVLLAVLADGIGGHRAGEVAADLAVNHMMQAVAHSDGRHIRRTIEEAVKEASEAIASHSAAN